MLCLLELLFYIFFLFHFSNFKSEYIMNAHCQCLLLFTSCHATWFPGSLFLETGNRERERETGYQVVVFSQSLGIIIARGRCVSGHVVRASFFFPGTLSRIHPRNALTEKAWEDAAQGLGKLLLMSLFFNPSSPRLININFLLKISINHQGKMFEELIK